MEINKIKMIQQMIAKHDNDEQTAPERKAK